MSAVTVERLYRSLYNTVHNKVICVGKNYAQHAKEMNSEVPKQPLLFDKAIGHISKSGEVLYLRKKNEVHHEIELGVLIGMTGRNI